MWRLGLLVEVLCGLRAPARVGTGLVQKWLKVREVSELQTQGSSLEEPRVVGDGGGMGDGSAASLLFVSSVTLAISFFLWKQTMLALHTHLCR